MQPTNQPTNPTAYFGEATYDPSDDKLRLRAVSRLSEDDYATAKAAGFRWAPKQELFYAHWNPRAAQLMELWCGEIQDEETTLEDRAAERAARFDTYAINRERDGDQANAASKELADSIPFGQPILVGHHSERRARKNAERIEKGLARAVKMWETAEYWQRRAQGAIASANYRDTPAVRARRIKTLEAERRKRVAEYTPQGSGAPFDAIPWRHKEGEDKDTRVPHVMTGQGRAKRPTRLDSLPAIERREAPWVAHLTMRIDYECAILESQGAAELLKPKARPKAPPILNYLTEGGEVLCRSKFYADRNGPVTLPQVSMTKAEYKALGSDYRGCWVSADGSHRVRIGMIPQPGKGRWQSTRSAVFLTDSKVHPIPAPQVETAQEAKP